MGNKLLTQRENYLPEYDKYARIDKTPQNLFTVPSLDQHSQSNWNNVTNENLYYRLQYGKFTLHRNQLTLQEVEKYKIVLKDSNEFNKFCQFLKWRNNCPYLPKIEHFIIENKQQICVSRFQINLLTQRIPLRLVDLTDIPFPQNLYFMTAILKGFKYIFGSKLPIKTFKVTQSMIGVNRQGQVKVWWNQNFSALQPVESKDKFISEQDFVIKVVDMVEENTDARQYPYPLRQYLNERNIPLNGDFNFVISQIYNYAKEMKVIIPRYAFSVREILTRDMFENTRISSENVSNGFIGLNNRMLREQSKKEINELYSFNKKSASDEAVNHHIDKKSIQLQEGQIKSDNILMHNYQHSHEELKNNQGLILARTTPHLITTQKPVLSGNQATLNNDGLHLIFHPTRVNTISPSKQHANISFVQSHKINQIENNFGHLPNKNYQISPNFIHPTIAPRIQRNSPIKIKNNMIAHSHPLLVNNDRNLTKPHFQSNLSSNQRSLSPFASNPLKEQDSLPMITSQYFRTNNLVTPPPNNQVVMPQRSRHNSYHISPSRQNQNNINSSYLLHQNSMPIFSNPDKPNQLSAQVQIQRIQKNPSFLSQQSSVNHILANNDSSNQMKINQNIKENQQIKLKYFTKKDSQQSLDPQIVADLAKYLNT